MQELTSSSSIMPKLAHISNRQIATKRTSYEFFEESVDGTTQYVILHYYVIRSTSLKTWITQLRKGLLEFCILNALANNESYGYELIQHLKILEELAITESTVYPILNRLRQDGYVKVHVVSSSAGPPRRYFSLTSLGNRRVRAMNEYWGDLCVSIGNLQSTDTRKGKT